MSRIIRIFLNFFSLKNTTLGANFLLTLLAYLPVLATAQLPLATAWPVEPTWGAGDAMAVGGAVWQYGSF